MYEINETCHNGEIEIRTKNGEKRVWDFYTTPIGKTADGQKLILTTADDVTQRISDNEKILELLSEKEILLKEVHHRVKNNTSIIKSLLYLQTQAITIPELQNVLKDAMSRLDSMSILYDKLYKTENYKIIHIKEYLSHLMDEICFIFTDKNKINVIKEIDDFEIDSKLLFSVGILINELITNSIKYAFKGRENGVILLSVKKSEKKVTVVFEDNGIGLNLDANLSKKGFGFQLIEMLVKQIKGQYKIESQNGTRFIIEFDC